jgi:excisionase family DNA binding protein
LNSNHGRHTSPSEVTLNEPLLKADDAAAMLRVSPSWVYEAVRTGRMPCLRIGKHIRFSRADLEVWVRGVRDAGDKP